MKAFAFDTEFTPHGDVVGGPAQKFFSRAVAETLAASARAEAEAMAQARGFASVDRVIRQLAPVNPQIVRIAEALRQEAAELALIAARKIAGRALDAHGSQMAVDAVAEAVRMLKGAPSIVVSAPADAVGPIERRLEQLKKEGRVSSISFRADPGAKPGDWQVEWGEGLVGFSRDHVEAAIEALLADRLQDPVQDQLDLFAVA